MQGEKKGKLERIKRRLVKKKYSKENLIFEGTF